MLLDTDVLIDILRNHLPAIAWFEGLEEVPTASGIAAMEIISGCRNRQELRAAELFLALFPIAWPTREDLERALGTLLPRRLTNGIGLLDSIVAATALGIDQELATFNVKHYSGVEGLRMVQPYKR